MIPFDGYRKGGSAGLMDGESRRDAARRAVSGQVGHDPIISEHGYGSEARATAKPEGPQPSDLAEARRLAARNAVAGGANSLVVPRAVRDAQRREAMIDAMRGASDEDIEAVVAGMDADTLEAVRGLIDRRRTEDAPGRAEAAMADMSAGLGGDAA